MTATDDPDFEVEKDPSGRYVRFNEVLGQGAFKTVYKAFDEIAGLEVAWNRVNIEDVLQQEPDKLYAEIHLLKSLKHDNIIKLYDFWVDEKSKTINMITELFTSGCLRNYRKKHRIVDMKAIKNWARQILRGLHYLHSHNPPIIHRDLKCENIFVNGNTGDVKIGDLGLAIVIEQATTRSVAGTPAFMAPELYDEDYNELVDVYSFGMCLLEMVTCEFPYRECLNSAQIYKKVISGVKPNSLSRVSDPKVKDFIEKCLVPVSSRLPAIELLNDPFLTCENPNPKNLPNIVSKFLDMRVSVGSCETPISSSFEELRKSNGNYEFRLRGKKVDEDQVLFTLRVVKACGSGKGGEQKIEFRFYLGSDSARSIANEMVEELKFSKEDVSVAAELIDSLILRIVPSCGIKTNASAEAKHGIISKTSGTSGCTTLDMTSSKGPKALNGFSLSSDFGEEAKSCDANKQHVVHSQLPSVRAQGSIESIMSNLSAKHGIISKGSGSSGCYTLDMTSSKGPKPLNGFSVSSDLGEKAKSCDANKQHVNVRVQDSVESIMSNLSAKHEIISKGSGSSGCTTLDMTSSKGPKPLNGFSVSSEFGEKAKCFDGNNVDESVVTINECSKNTDLDELKPELDYIDAQYNQCIHELLKMKEEAIENAKKRWMAKKSSPISS